MNKRIIIKFIIVTLFCLILNYDYKVDASTTNTKVYFVFDKTTYNKGENVKLNINLDQFSNLNEIKLQIKLDLEYLEPVLIENEYFTFTNSSICTNDILNDFTNEKVLRLHLLKENNINGGYYSSYKSNICHIQFKTKKAIDNIYKYFNKNNYNNYGVSLYLFDTSDNLIEYECNYLEKINILWEKESYTLNVYDEIPNFKEDIIVKNRELFEYEYLIEKSIDTSTIGLKTIHIAIYDILTADYVVISKAINVVDQLPPIIEMESSLNIKDIDLDKIVFEDYVKVSDNYDINVKLNAYYFNSEFDLIKTNDEFKTYLKNNLLGYIKYSAVDSSKNVTETEYVEVNMMDTISPNINKIDIIEIHDIAVDNFNIENCFNIIDNYDDKPLIVIIYNDFNNKTFDEIKGLLKVGTKITFSYYGIDKFGNKSVEYVSSINPIDTTRPVIEVNDIVVNDFEYTNLDLNRYLRITDNFNNEINLITKYYIDDIEVLKDEFDKCLLKGKDGYIKYLAYDNFNNYSNEVVQKIEIIDTIKPTINIKNIKEGEKYISLEKIEYEIYDNFEGCSIKVLLDNEVYNGNAIEIGKHILYIEAIDLVGNKEEVKISFEVIQDNIIGCGDDFSCYITNYIEIVIIVGVLLLFVIGMIIAHLIVKNKKEETI